jgi:hypothetical protein
MAALSFRDCGFSVSGPNILSDLSGPPAVSYVLFLSARSTSNTLVVFAPSRHQPILKPAHLPPPLYVIAGWAQQSRPASPFSYRND